MPDNLMSNLMMMLRSLQSRKMLRGLTTRRPTTSAAKFAAGGNQSPRLPRPIFRDSSILAISSRYSLGCTKLVQNAISLEIATSTWMKNGCSALRCCSTTVPFSSQT